MIRATISLEIEDHVGRGLTEREIRHALIRAIDDRVVRDQLCIVIGHTSNVKVERYEQA